MSTMVPLTGDLPIIDVLFIVSKVRQSENKAVLKFHLVIVVECQQQKTWQIAK